MGGWDVFPTQHCSALPIVWAESRTSPSRLAGFQQSWGTFPEGTDLL